ncbi:hypothetical protein ACHFJ0_20950 [Paracoccus sp. NGMCC 1.201697]|uniref:Uncharacterized protein n=1 Tax=Paracoccus broussonetiae subsp. drimophilus TaxID=3373869 RepID=A0ABW7LTW2_9RHOB
MEGWGQAGLWLSVLLSGAYHGANPGMGWPLAVSAGLMGRGRRDLLSGMGQLAVGHLASVLAILLPFALALWLVAYQDKIRIAASLLVILFGCYRLVERRHPRGLARIRPGQLALWSFAIALVHGAGLMILPIYLGLCRTDDHHGAALAQLAPGNIGTAIAVAVVHTVAMVAVGGGIALAVHGWLGLGFVSRSWFNLETFWALSLITIGLLGLVS